MVGEVKLSITSSWVQNLSLPDERSNHETSRRIGFYSVYLVSLYGLPFIQLYFKYNSPICNSDFLIYRTKKSHVAKQIVHFVQGRPHRFDQTILHCVVDNDQLYSLIASFMLS